MTPLIPSDPPTRSDDIQPARALRLSAPHATLIEHSARRARPLEYCAALVGHRADSHIVVTDVIRLRNSDTRHGCFAIADAEIRRAHCVAHELGCELVAIVHSHAQTAAVPSARDRLAMARSQYPWVIAGFDSYDVVQLAAFCAGSGDPLSILQA